jgi:hypothetical protein
MLLAGPRLQDVLAYKASWPSRVYLEMGGKEHLKVSQPCVPHMRLTHHSCCWLPPPLPAGRASLQGQLARLHVPRNGQQGTLNTPYRNVCLTHHSCRWLPPLQDVLAYKGSWPSRVYLGMGGKECT